MNKLVKRNVSKNINKGKVDNDQIDLSVVADPKGFITDGCYEYYNSKFQFSDFYNKDIQPKDWITKPRFLLEYLNEELFRYDKKGLESFFNYLVLLYRDLDTCLQRLYDGYHDSCFIRFAFKAGIFTTELHWQHLLRNWERGFMTAIERYYNECHSLFDPSMNMSYIAYFDLHFPQLLYYGLSGEDYRSAQMNITLGYARKSLELVRIDHLLPLQDIYYDLDIKDVIPLSLVLE